MEKDIVFNEINAIIDVSANAVPTVETLKKQAVILKKFGYRAMYLSFADLFEIEGEPYFGYQRGRYTKKELNELDIFCKEIGLELRPAIQTLSHLFFVWKYAVYGKCMETMSTLLAGEPSTYKLLEKMFASISESISSRKIHIGLDDTYYVGRCRHIDIYGYEDLFEVFCSHLKKVAEIAEKYGYECEMWAQPFTKEYAKHFENKSLAEIRKEASVFLPENVSISHCNYTETDNTVIKRGIEKCFAFTDKVSFTAGALKGYGFTPDNELSIRAIKAGIDACKEKNVREFNVFCLSEHGAEQSLYCALPSLYFASEYAFKRCSGINDLNKKKFEDITGGSFDAFMFLDLPNKPHPDVKYRTLNTKSYFYFYNDILLGLMDKLISKNTGRDYKRVAEILNNAAMGQYAYIFKTAAALCKVLENKAELGKNLKECYDGNDRIGMRKIALDIIPQIVSDINIFYDLFEAQWYKENKTFGFEPQTEKIGGLTERLNFIAKRITGYLNGEADSILELETERVLPGINVNMPSLSSNPTEDDYVLYDWSFIVSVSFT